MLLPGPVMWPRDGGACGPEGNKGRVCENRWGLETKKGEMGLSYWGFFPSKVCCEVSQVPNLQAAIPTSGKLGARKCRGQPTFLKV